MYPFLQVPRTPAEWEAVASDFEMKWQFPNCVAAMDCKHFQVVAPRGRGSFHFNYKGFHSVVLLALVNANYEILYADIGMNGRVSDATAWHHSRFRAALQSGQIRFPRSKPLPGGSTAVPHVIVADDAFPLSMNLMKPFPIKKQTAKQRIFSYRLSRARRVAENAFGILSNKFRVFLAPIHLEPSKVTTVVLACLAMHNLLRRTCPDMWTLEDEATETIVLEPWQRRATTSKAKPRNYPADARAVRQVFSDYFAGSGAVPWQNDLA